MSLDQSIQMLFDQTTGEKYPRLVIRANGVHDVGRLLAALARGTCEHLGVAHDAARELNRQPEGRYTLAYLERHGGPKLAPPSCDPCAEGNHDDCWQGSDDYDPIDGPCGCYEAETGWENRHRREVST